MDMHRPATDVVDDTTHSETDDLLSEVLAKPTNISGGSDASTLSIEGVVIGTLMSVGGEGVFVNYPGNPAAENLTAIVTKQVSARDVGRPVALMFAEHNPLQPIIIGFIEDLGQGGQQANISIDGERFTFSANKEVVLKCGKASITLTKAGKILIRGEYVLSRSSGVNHIKGGSIQLN